VAVDTLWATGEIQYLDEARFRFQVSMSTRMLFFLSGHSSLAQFSVIAQLIFALPMIVCVSSGPVRVAELYRHIETVR